MYVVLYHATWCGYCKNFVLSPDGKTKSMWKHTQAQLRKISIKTKEYEHTKDQQFMRDKGISSFPTLRLETKEGRVLSTFQGERSPANIVAWVRKSMK